jgi:LysM repeat protein
MATSYSVASGDTASAIAKKYGTTVSALQAANPQYSQFVSNPNYIQAGWSLNLPGAAPSAPVTTTPTPVAPVSKPASTPVAPANTTNLNAVSQGIQNVAAQIPALTQNVNQYVASQPQAPAATPAPAAAPTPTPTPAPASNALITPNPTEAARYAGQQLNVDTSIVDYLKSVGVDSSWASRQAIAAKMGIANYTGTAEQNIAMLKAVKAGGGAAPSAGTPATPAAPAAPPSPALAPLTEGQNLTVDTSTVRGKSAQEIADQAKAELKASGAMDNEIATLTK